MTEDVGAPEPGTQFMASGTWLVATNWAFEPGRFRCLPAAPMFDRASCSGETDDSISLSKRFYVYKEIGKMNTR